MAKKKRGVHRTLEEAFAWVKALNREGLNDATHRGYVLLGVAAIDDLLYRILKGYLVKDESGSARLLEDRGPLTTLSAKIDMCRMLGLIVKDEAHFLHELRKLRNDFAHDIGEELEASPNLVAKILKMSAEFEFYFPEVRPSPKNNLRYYISGAILGMHSLLSTRLNDVVEQGHKAPLVDGRRMHDRIR